MIDLPYVARARRKDPYLISWELLVSAEETYAPHQDSYEIPARISYLNGKHIRIAATSSPQRIERAHRSCFSCETCGTGAALAYRPRRTTRSKTSLKEPLSADDLAFANFGTLDGVLKVDPLVKGAWLLGLFVVGTEKCTSVISDSRCKHRQVRVRLT
jgi:hypothetical protein